MLVGNFTPDDIQWEHVGQVGVVKAGTVEDLYESRANFVLTKFGPRGLLRVNWNDRDDMEKYGSKAMEIYTHFWEMQISTFNQQNEQRHNENKAYVYPTGQLQQKAAELGIELIAPWKVNAKTDSKEIRELKEENAALKDDLKELRAGFQEMIGLMKELKTKPTTPVVVDTEASLKQFRNLGKDRYENWIENHLEEVPLFPESVYQMAKEKWGNFYKEPWPADPCVGPKDM